MNSTEKRRKQLRRRLIIAGLIFLLVIAAILYRKFRPNPQIMDPAEYFQREMQLAGAEGEDAVLSEGEIAVVLEDRIDPRKSLLRDGSLYLNYSIVRENITTRFFLDEERDQLLYTMPEETWQIPIDSSTYLTESGEQKWEKEIVVRRNGILYLSAEFLAQKINLEYLISEDLTHVLVHYKWGDTKTCRAKRKTRMRSLPTYKAARLTDVPASSCLRYLSEEGKWILAVSEDGFIGYVPASRMEVQTEEITREFTGDVYESISLGERVNLVWHQIDVAEMNANLKEDTQEVTGVNVISPTWFMLSDNYGNFDSFADHSYVEQAHKMGYQIWGLVNNFSPDVSSAQIFASNEARGRLAEGLTAEALEYDLDGINVDLEAIRSEAGYGYVQFVRELSVLCRKNGLILSIDVPVPMDFNWYYNRTELGVYCDYVIVMGYDEHYYGSDAGSVASISFEENGIINTLKTVPAGKIISGVPFYTRIWKTITHEDGNTEVTSRLATMDSAAEAVKKNGAEPEWNEDTAQYYASWTDPEDGGFCEVWLEEEESIARKAELVSTYQLGGIAAWVLGDERSSIWDVISKSIAEE